MTDSLAYLNLTDNQKKQVAGFNETAAKSLGQLAQEAKTDTSFHGKALFGPVMGIFNQRNNALKKILIPEQIQLYQGH